MSTETEERERDAIALRAEYLAGLPTPDLLKEATDPELSEEGLRCGREFTKPTRNYAISHALATERMELGIKRLGLHVLDVQERVRREALTDSAGPNPSVLIELATALQAAKVPADLRKALAASIEPDEITITREDERAKHKARKRELDQRRAEIANELQRRRMKL